MGGQNPELVVVASRRKPVPKLTAICHSDGSISESVAKCRGGATNRTARWTRWSSEVGDVQTLQTRLTVKMPTR